MLELPLQNLAGANALTRLKAVHEIGKLLARAIDLAELEQVRVARSKRPPDTWREIGDVLNISHTEAMRRFAKRVK